MTAGYEHLADALPGYEIGDEIGRGAWGVVIAGRHRALGREVAIKQLAIGLGADEGARRRFLAEAQALARFDHPHIVRIFDFVEHDGECLLVMERLTGGTAFQRMRSTTRRRRPRAAGRSRSAPASSTRTSARSCIATSSPRT